MKCIEIVRAKSCSWYTVLANSLVICSAVMVVTNLSPFSPVLDSAKAQSVIIPDGTLGTESSQVIPNYLGRPWEVITNGAIRDNNVFHSLLELNVSERRQAFFLSPNSNIRNIIARVTGNNRSLILGTLGAIETKDGRTVLSNANLFLINPNGITFGPKAELLLNGSFVASTASSIQFSDGSIFSANTSQIKPLLTVSVPLGLQFGKNPGDINVQGELTGAPDKTLALIGGNVTLNGGILRAESGQIALGGILETGTIELNLNSKNQPLIFPNTIVSADVSLNNQSVVNVSGSRGGNIQIQGRYVSLNNQSIAFAANIPVANAQNHQNGGEISIQAEKLTIQNGSQVSNITRSNGSGGNIAVVASDKVELIGISANKPSGLFTQTFSTGDAGSLTIDTQHLIVKDGAQVRASTEKDSLGKGGNLTVRASDKVEIIGTDATGKQISALFSETYGKGAAGNLTIETGNLIVNNGANISTSSRAGSQDRGGNLTVRADKIELSGTSAIGLASGLFAQTLSNAAAGSVIINTRELIIKDGAVVTAGTNEGSQGNGGTLTIHALDKVELSGTAPNGKDTSGLFARTRGSGAAGDLTVTTGKLIVRDGAQITVSSLSSGAAGNLTVTANSISLDNGAIVAQTNSGNGGNITLKNLNLLSMRRNSQISAAAFNQANGGNIRIEAPNGFIVAVPQENSDILANAFKGNGGNINMTASAIYGLENRTQQFLDNNISEINASSELGVNGSIEINNTDIDPSQGLVELPVNLVDASQQIATSCTNGRKTRSSFTSVGRGGIPESPTEPLMGDAVLADWVTLPEVVKERSARTTDNFVERNANSPTQIVEADRWVVNANGEIILVAQEPTTNSSLFNPESCSSY